MIDELSGPREKGGWDKIEDAHREVTVAVLIPCFNEEVTVADVVQGFRRELPHAVIYVFDNNSSDLTVERAVRAGAVIHHERRQGKGYVVQEMFRRIDADVYVLVDGDGTYAPDAVHKLIAPIIAGEADTVVGSRLHNASQSEFRSLNRFGNKLFQHALNFLFRVELTDILSGYRAFSRRFVKDVPLFGGGFEIETELTIKAISRGHRVVEVPINLTPRPADSHSKINIFRDGVIIFNTILALFRDYKPLTFFGAFGTTLVVGGFLLGAVLLWSGGASAVRLTLTIFLLFCGALSVAVGLVLHTVTRRAQEHDYQLRRIVDELDKRESIYDDIETRR